MTLRHFNVSIWREGRASRNRGAALMVTLLFFIAISSAVIVGATKAVNRELRTYQNISTSKFSYFAAESGIEDVVYRLRSGKQLGSAVTIALNGATSTVAVTTVDATHKTVTATGTAQARYRQIDLDISKSSASPFVYAAQVGGGGITLTSSGSITGDAVVGGPVTTSSSGGFSGNLTVTATTPADMTAQQSTYDADVVVGDSDLNPQIDVAQSFVAPVSGKLVRVTLYMKRNATWSGSSQNATVRIATDVSGVPNTSALASGPAMNGNYGGTTYAWQDISFSSPATLSAGETYWIVFDAASHASRNWSWGKSNSDTYGSGSAKHNDSWTTSGWSDLTGDMNFKVAIASGSSTITRSGGSASINGTTKADTIDSADINGDAYYQAIINPDVSGTQHPGSPTPPPVPMPLASSTIQGWKDVALAGGTITGDYTVGSSDKMLGPKKITGNLTLTSSGDLSVTGTLYVEGYVRVSSSGDLKCDSAYGANSCIVIADKYIDLSSSGSALGSGVSSNSYMLLLSTTKNCYGSGSPGPCAGTGDAIKLSSSGGSVLLYATDGQVTFASSGSTKALAGYKLILSSSGSVSYNADILNAVFAPSATGTSGGQWTINSWRERR